ncbi:trypsin-like serine protease, partial [Aquimarina agarivorans]|uniref:trypsin-like serine protease n=1 Tax=Aquimarina agarivorans TaxID=980584 RepID=UPI000248EFAC
GNDLTLVLIKISTPMKNKGYKNICFLALFVILAIVTSFAQGKSKFKSQISNKIVNGNNVLIENHPYQVDLNGCGGAILGSTWIITAEHCIFGDGTNIVVGAGYTRISESSEGQFVRIKRAIRNPNSNSDMALLELESPLDLSGKFAKAIPYASSVVFENALVSKDALCFSTGWGLTDPNNQRSAPDHLQGAVLKFGDVALSDDRIRVEEFEGRMACRGG